MNRLLLAFKLIGATAACAGATNPPHGPLGAMKPALPSTVEDTVLQVAIRDAFGSNQSATVQRILLQPPPGVDPHRILPRLPRITFVVLTSSEFQALAERSGRVVRWEVSGATIRGDSATVSIWQDVVSARDSARWAGGGGCMYVLSRGPEGWRVVRQDACLYLD